jgi:hypothetical protein
VLALATEVRTMAREGQAFMTRAVRYLVDEGITQFVSLGVGLPTQSSVHHVAQALLPDARVVYVSTDPVVLSHARALLATNPATAVVEGDILHPRELLADPELRRLIDLDRPVAILISSALQFIPDEDDPFKCVAILRDALPVGSGFAFGHVVFDRRPEVKDPRPQRGRRPHEQTGTALLRRAGARGARFRLHARLASRQPPHRPGPRQDVVHGRDRQEDRGLAGASGVGLHQPGDLVALERDQR